VRPPAALRPDRQTRCVRARLTTFLLATGASLLPLPAATAQSLGDLAAWDALVVSPLGALPDGGAVPYRAGEAGTSFTVQYGRWRYDADDAIHNDMGLTVSRPIGSGRMRVAATAALLSLSCADCQTWLSGGVDLRAPVLLHWLAGSAPDGVTGEVGMRVSAGAARYRGDGHAVAYAIAGSVPLSITAPGPRASRVAFTVQPGVGIGRLSSADNDAYGTLPLLGASVSVDIIPHVCVEATMQRMVLSGAPSQLGIALTWVRP
jgi:hypothetical protein